MQLIPRHYLNVLENFAHPCPVIKNATASARPTTVLLDPSTKADPLKFTVRILQLVQANNTCKDPPRPLGSTLVTTRMPTENKRKKYL